ncbi:MAG: glycosyltransferase family 4 protein, partial [Oscillospiraceae bacterium]|nr:glycosyltransferase family 4 protein [Oscillospiraceae bacterium]
MPPADVRKYMDTSDIFLFTSNRKEGWGAVVNEAMSSGCAIVASSETGSVPFLIKDGYNGFVYYRNNQKELYEKVEKLVFNSSLRETMGENAYLTMKNMWSPENAANRLIKLCEGLLQGAPPVFEDGPCSEAY